MNDVPVATTPTYCQAADVGLVMQVPTPSAGADQGEPTLDYWNDVIMSVEERIDAHTFTSWRERKVTAEYAYDGLSGLNDFEGFILVPLRRSPIKDLLTASGDKLEVWNGLTFDDWLTTHIQGRQADWYLEGEYGHLRLRTRVVYGQQKGRVRVTYRYGAGFVPRDIKRATALLAACELTSGQVTSQHGRGSDLDYTGNNDRRGAWEREAAAIVSRYAGIGSL